VAVPRHEKIVPKDEVGAIRAEVYRSFRITEVAPGTSKLESSGSIDLHGWVPQGLADMIVVPTQLAQLRSLQSYFQHIRPLSECDAEDGQLVGRLLIDLVDSKPKNLAQAIRTFANRTAMLRECCLNHIGVMLAHLLSAEPQDDSGDAAAITAVSPSMVTEQQAATIGSAIASSVRRSHVPARAVQKVVRSIAVLRAMKSGYAWFDPMLEVLTASKRAKARRSTFVKRSIMIVVGSVAPTDTESDADGADEDFNSVVSSSASRCLNLQCSHVRTSWRHAGRQGLLAEPPSMEPLIAVFGSWQVPAYASASEAVAALLEENAAADDSCRVQNDSDVMTSGADRDFEAANDSFLMVPLGAHQPSHPHTVGITLVVWHSVRAAEWHAPPQVPANSRPSRVAPSSVLEQPLAADSTAARAVSS
jgi:hypothetical protein